MTMFVYPAVLIFLILIPTFAGLFVLQTRRRQRRLALLGDETLIAQLRDNVSQGRRRLKSGLWLLAAAALIAALARPAWGIAEEIVQTENIAVMVVLDVSKSMDAQDVSPSRLERAKLTARQIYDASRGKQVGLILFAGEAAVQFPLTGDTEAAKAFLDAATTEAITRQGTALENALRLALDTLDERVASESVIVVMSDGENHRGNPEAAAQEAAKQGVTIHAIGYGTTEGATIPTYNADGELTGSLTDDFGNVVESTLNEEPLGSIAQQTGGIYRRAQPNSIEVVDILNRIDTLESQQTEASFQIRRVDRFALFVALALLALSLDMVLPEAPPRREARA